MKHLIIIIFSVLLIGCGKNNANDVTKLEGAPAPFDGSKKLHFALIRQALEGEFLQMWQTGSQKQADLMGIKLTVLGKNMDNQAQADFIYQAINMKVDGIILDHGLTETLSKPAADAVAAGIPVVAFDVDVGPREIIQNGKNGFLIEDRNIDLMIKKIDELLSNDEIRKNFGANALESVKKFYGKKIISLWNNIMNDEK